VLNAPISWIIWQKYNFQLLHNLFVCAKLCKFEQIDINHWSDILPLSSYPTLIPQIKRSNKNILSLVSIFIFTAA